MKMRIRHLLIQLTGISLVVTSIVRLGLYNRFDSYSIVNTAQKSNIVIE